MFWKKLAILIMATFFLNGCCFPKKYYMTEYRSIRPKKSHFELKKKRNASDPFINENFIYVKVDSAYFKTVSTGEMKLSVSRYYERFFKTGQYIQGRTKMDFNSALADYNNLKSGIVGYYKIEKDKIKLNYFLVTAQDCGAYYKTELKMIGDSIEGYKKIEVQGLTGIPDW